MSDTPTGDSPLLCPDRERNNQDTSLAAIAAGSHLDHLHIARIGKLCPLIFQKTKKAVRRNVSTDVPNFCLCKKYIFYLFFFVLISIFICGFQQNKHTQVK